MIIAMFNAWYFFWLFLCAGITVALYYLFRNTSRFVQKTVLFSLLAFAFLMFFLKSNFPPYSVDEARKLRDSWFVNICAANVGLFPFLFFSKNKYVKDYMFYLGVISGLVALIYPQDPLSKEDQIRDFWDILLFYCHHWTLLAVPLLMVLWGHHRLSYRRILSAPIGLLLLMLFIMLNQIFQSELGFIPLRGDDMLHINYKNTSYIWGPGTNDAIGNFFAMFCPNFFKVIPIGAYAGQEKYWPWFWLIFPVFILVTPLAFLLCMIFDHQNFTQDVKKLFANLRQSKIAS